MRAGAQVQRRGSDLGAVLRERTRSAHAAAERAMDLPTWLESVSRYADLLGMLHAFHASWGPAVVDLEALVPPPLRGGHDVRCARLAADLVRLDRDPTREAMSDPPHLPTPDHRLGACYVLEGAALGGLVIAAEVRRRLPAAAAATTYFQGEGRRTATRWRTFQSVLRRWGAHEDAAQEAAVSGALETFAALTARLEASRVGV